VRYISSATSASSGKLTYVSSASSGKFTSVSSGTSATTGNINSILVFINKKEKGKNHLNIELELE